jgi:hypothetical protein
MKLKLSIFPVLALIVFATIFFTSCSKRRELKELGCVRGKTYYTQPSVNIGPMTKKEFLQYLDSPIGIYKGGIVKYDMTWKKIDSPTECPVDL